MNKISTSLLSLVSILAFTIGFATSHIIKRSYQVKKEVAKHEHHGNLFHRDGKTTEVYSHTFRYGDTMRVEIDTFIYR